MDIRVYEEALKKIEHEIAGLNKKDTLSVAEIANLKEALCAAKSIMDIIGEIPQDAQDSYSNGVTGSYSLRPGFKYEYSEGMPDHSYRRGRSMTTGRYVSRGHDRFYSGHSIYDILVANMELTYNDCKSEHDEKIIDTAIRMVNQNR